MVYDSLYNNIDPQTLGLIPKLLGRVVNLKLHPSPWQVGLQVQDCGLFAIAICTSLVHGQDIKEETMYNQSLMRQHLFESFQNLILTPFP